MRGSKVKRFQELPSTTAVRSKSARNKGRREQELPRAYLNRDLQEQGNEKQGPPGSRASGSFRHRGPQRERKSGVRASKGERVRSKIESVVQSNAITGPEADTQDPTKGRRENPENSNKEECN